MFERFTSGATKVMQAANQEAQRFNHEYIGTEHVLLGLVKFDDGIAAEVLKNMGIDLRKIRLEVEKLIASGPEQVTVGSLPQTPRAKKVVKYAMEEARNLSHNYVGTEHLLLGLLREQDGVAAQVLMNLGLKLAEVREEILSLLGVGQTDDVEDTTTEQTEEKLPFPKVMEKKYREEAYQLDAQLRAASNRTEELEKQIQKLKGAIDSVKHTIQTRLIVTYQTDVWLNIDQHKEVVEEVRFLRHLHGLL